MRRMICLIATLSVAVMVSSSCAGPESANAGNKSGNAGNSASNAAAVPAVTGAALEADIKKLVNETAAALARNDVATLDKMYADNYMLVNLDGSVQNKTERLGSFKSGDTKFESFAYDEVNVRTNPEGTGAVVVARATAKGMNKGKPVASNVRVTQVWSKTNAGWRQVSGSAVQIADGVKSDDDSSKAEHEKKEEKKDDKAASPPANK